MGNIDNVRFTVNGSVQRFRVGVDMQPSDTLAHVLREKLFLTGTKVACNEGTCGACTVLMDGRPILSCMTLAIEADGHDIVTIEGVPEHDPMVQAFVYQHEPGYGTAMQCGTCTPGFVMAAKGLLLEKPQPTKEEIKDALSGHVCRCGCYPAIERAVYRASRQNDAVEPPRGVPFAPRVERTHTGKYRSRIDALEKTRGQVQFINDMTIGVRFPGLLHARYLRSPYAHARIRSYDISRAAALEGVRAILTYDDPEVRAIRPFHGAWTDGANNANYRTQFFPEYQDRKTLDNHVRWVGDEAGFAVAAESEEIAESALRLIEVEWEVLPFVLSVDEALAENAPVLHPEINAEGNALPWSPFGGPYAQSEKEDGTPPPVLPENVSFQKGDVDKAIEEADELVEGHVYYCDTTQSSMDPWCCVSHWTASGLTVHSNSYEADQLRLFLSDMLGLSQKQVRCISPYVGGSFGRGDTGEQPFFLVTALLSKRTGRPVKFRHTRRESFQNGRTIVHGDVRIGARKDGTILGIHLRETADVGAYLDHALAPVKFVPIEAIETQCHHIPSVKLETFAVYTNKMSGSCMRAIGNIQFNFLLGLGIDELAERLSIDPVELVVKNFGDHLPLPNESIGGLLKEGAQRIGWKQKRAAADKDRSSSSVKKRGVGFSFHNEWHVLWQERRRGPITVGIKVNPDGTVVLDAPTIETGPGTNSVAVHICSEVLGVSVEQITWISTVDTLTSPKDQVQTDSAVSIIFAEAVSVVAKEARARLLALAAPLLGSDPDQLTIEDGVIYCPHPPKRQKTIQEVLEAGDMVPLVTVRDYDIPLDDRGTPFRATFAEVEVDTTTGELQVIKLVVLDDMGTVLSPAGAEGQAIGGQCQGLGETLTEYGIYDRQSGKPLNFNWVDYHIHTTADFPDIEAVPMEVWLGAGEYGASGMGEGVMTCTPRAIANAIHNATGVRVDDLPITVPKLQAVLGIQIPVRQSAKHQTVIRGGGAK